MKLSTLAGGVAAAILITVTSLAATPKVDFNGTWALDKDRSEGVPAGMDQTMTVNHTGNQVDVEMKVTSNQSV